MKSVSSLMEMQALADQSRGSHRKIGFVPTMGSLHEGHLSLIRTAREQCDDVITSIFVNPAQFAPDEDYEKYPRDIQKDTVLAVDAGSDYLFIPAAADIYPPGFSTFVTMDGISAVWEGAIRPTHFRGVATVVLKLLQLTKPHMLYLGQKDVQQCVVLRRMVKELNVDVEIFVCPTIRESDGLAMSSRNVYLSLEDRKKAPILFQTLKSARERIDAGIHECASLRREMESLLGSAAGVHIDYIAIIDGETLQPLDVIDRSRQTIIALAARFGTTRLIDNVIIEPALP
ncbi:MAG: pantoate--beta-alanine ligase [Ignavibacteriales bacterium]|nr:pantoate--beta-alanine ligase [Ignavibacteriales bacterium]